MVPLKREMATYAVFIFLFAGCASAQHPTAFLGSDAPLLGSGHYFSGEYAAPNTHWSHYSKVKALPVTLDYFSSSDIKNIKTIEPLAKIMQKQFENILKLSRTIIPADGVADAQTLIIEPTLVQISGSYNFINVESLAVGGAVTSGTTSFEFLSNKTPFKNVITYLYSYSYKYL